MKLKSGFALREVAGEQVLMPVGENISRFEGAVILSEVAVFAYRKLEEYPEGLDLDRIAGFITENYDVDEETAKKDIAEVMDQLKKYGIVEE